ncbi:hypothetical protein SDC9_42566 [bioreactor metagenome]|uniref:Major facilitator superfamily (MFS) profile domain-containing protein n=1 Tax=bioreactor metagenome TaxID=1076179 RepID=A0A644VYE4_9ZZZZ
MEQTAKKSGIHYGWIVAAACCLISALGTGLLMNSLGTFIKPVSTAMGFDRGKFSLAVSMLSLIGVFVFPYWGKLMQKVSIRKLIMIAAVVIGGSLYAISFCTKLWQFYALHILIGLFNGGVATLPVSTLVSRWFISKKGTAMGIATCGSGLGSMILVPLVSRVTTAVSWQAAYRFLGVMFICVALFAAVLFIRDRPSDKGLEAYRITDAGSAKGTSSGKIGRTWDGLTKSEALKTSCMKYFSAGIVMTGILYSGMISHIYAYLTDISFPAAKASSIISISMFVLLCGKFILGMIFDRFGTKIGIYLSYGCFALAFVCLIAAASNSAFAYAYCLFGGFGVSVSAVGIAYITDYFFGPKEYSMIFGLVSSMLLIGTTIGTTLSGFLYDTFGTYRFAWFIYFAAVMVVIFLLAKANRSYEQDLLPLQKQSV